MDITKDQIQFVSSKVYKTIEYLLGSKADYVTLEDPLDHLFLAIRIKVEDQELFIVLEDMFK